MVAMHTRIVRAGHQIDHISVYNCIALSLDANRQNAYIVHFDVSNVYYFFGLMPSFFQYKAILVNSRNMSIEVIKWFINVKNV